MLSYITIKKKFQVLFFLSAVIPVFMNAQTSTINGAWSNNATWGGVTAPSETVGSGDVVEIATGDTVTLSSKLDVKSNGTLDVYGYLIVTSLDGIVFWNGCNVVIHSGGTLKCETGVTNNNASGITVNGSLICLGDYEAGTGSVMGGTGAIQVQGTLTVQGSADVMGVLNPGCDACNVTEAGGIVDAGIYNEDFSSNDGKGYGNTSGVTNWLVDGTGSPSGYFKVSGGKFASNNLDQTMNWYSKLISGSYSSIEINIDAGVNYGYSGQGINFYYSIDGGAWVNFGSYIKYTASGTNGGSWSGSTLTIMDLSCSSSFQVKCEYYSTSSYSDYYHDNVAIYGIQNTTPSISTSGSLSAFSSCSGTNSSNQTFTVQGANMNAGILINPPSGYEVSSTSDFSSNVGTNGSGITIGSSGTIALTTIYVRTTTSASNGDGGNIECTSTGATQVDIATGSASISSDTYYVSTTGSDSNNGITSGTAFATLQKAIDMVSSSCTSTTIHVAAGTYTEDGVSISNKSNISIIGAGIGSTIFDGDFGNRFMAITGTSDNISISNMKIMEMDEGTVNGTYSGGGMYITSSGTIELTSIEFKSCRCDVNGGSGGGGAIYVGSSATVNIYKSSFSNNRNSRTHSAQDGGAICNTGTIHIENSLFYNNPHEYSYGYDGTIVFKGGGDGSIVNSTITYNLANNNGRIPLYVDGSGSTVTILNSILYGYPGGYNIRRINTPTINSINCIGYNGNVWDGAETNCYTTTDFGFVNIGSYDFSLSSSSYCKDKGTSSIASPVSLTAPSDDFAGITRSGNPDVGCYEFAGNTWTGAVSTAWTNTGNWSLGTVPTSADSPIIPSVANLPAITSDVTLTGLVINSSASITITSNSLTVSGDVDLNGTMNIDNATVNVDGSFDATGGTIDFTNANGKLILSSAVTSLGTLDAAMGTVEYDGSTQTVANTDYYNLEIDASGTKTAAGNITVNGNFTTAATAGCKLDMGAYDLTIAGNLTVGATDGLDLSDASSDLIFNGTADQTVAHAGNTSYEVYNMTINKSSGNVLLNNEIEANGVVTFTDGYVDASSANLAFTNSASLSGVGDASHVIGSVKKTTSSTTSFTFPVGNGVTYRPIGITPSTSSATIWTANYVDSAYADLDVDLSGLDHASAQEYWNLNRSGSANAILTLTWAVSNAVTDYTQLRIAHYDGSTDWDMIASATSGDNSSGTITSSAAVSTFSPFTIGSATNANPLPVSLSHFTGFAYNEYDNKLE
ncbi:MAG: beta strand repeat-containing protein, partial [Crocinitomicaceae bacterium]